MKSVSKQIRRIYSTYAEQYDLDIAIRSYTLASHNANDKIYELLLQDPSQDTIRERFEQSFDEWKESFANTAFENYVDKEEAMKFYPGGAQKLVTTLEKMN